MKLVSFNVNGIRARIHQLETLIEKYQPDVIGIQESKVTDELFPTETINNLGYNVAFFGQKSHYGVALLYKATALSIQKGLPTDTDDAQRRIIQGSFQTPSGKTLHIINGYFPQGEKREHPKKFPAKQKFYADLLQHLNQEYHKDDYLAVIGDFNVAPKDEDIGIGDSSAKRWLKEGKTSFLPEEREWLNQLQNWGLHDCYRMLNNQLTEEKYSWFDYRNRGFEKHPKKGLRIDFMLCSEPLAKLAIHSDIDYDIRAMEKPSDHCPVITKFDLG